MNTFEDIWEKTRLFYEALGESLMAELDGITDPILVTLKGHLVAERMLREALSGRSNDPSLIEKARLRFPQIANLVQALQKIPAAPDWLWDGLHRLNSLRNQLAHNLSVEDVDDRIDLFVRATLGASPEPQEIPNDRSEALVHAIHFLLGGLQVAIMFDAGVEAMAVASGLSKCERSTS